MCGVRRKEWKSVGGECGEVCKSVLGCGGQRWARYFFKVPAVPVLGTLLKVPAVPVLENQKYRRQHRGTFVGTFENKFQKESTALYFVDL